MLPLLAAAVACTLKCTIPFEQGIPNYENEDIKYIHVVGYKRCPYYDVYPFNWRLCQYPDTTFSVGNVEGRQGQTVILPIIVNWYYTVWVYVLDEVFNRSPPSNMIGVGIP